MLVLLCPGPWSLNGSWNPVGYHTDVLVGGMAFSSLQNLLYCKMPNKSLLSFVTQLTKTTSSLAFVFLGRVCHFHQQLCSLCLLTWSIRFFRDVIFHHSCANKCCFCLLQEQQHYKKPSKTSPQLGVIGKFIIFSVSY